MNILFLCTGNTCRSPMAAALFRQHCAQRGTSNFTVQSAGICAAPAAPAAPHAVAAAAEHGADCSTHRAVQATPALLAQADAIVCLSTAHAQQAARYVPPAKLHILSGGIADPYGGSLADYRACAAQILQGITALYPALCCPAQIVPADPAQLPAFAALEREAFTPPASEARLGEKLALPYNHSYTALYHGAVAGFLIVDEIAGEAFIDDLAVFPARRRQGIASALLARAETEALLRGCTKLHLEARESNHPALTLYNARGYQTVGRRKNYYNSPPEDAILLTLQAPASNI